MFNQQLNVGVNLKLNLKGEYLATCAQITCFKTASSFEIFIRNVVEFWIKLSIRIGFGSALSSLVQQCAMLAVVLVSDLIVSRQTANSDQ